MPLLKCTGFNDVSDEFDSDSTLVQLLVVL